MHADGLLIEQLQLQMQKQWESHDAQLQELKRELEQANRRGKAKVSEVSGVIAFKLRYK